MDNKLATTKYQELSLADRSLAEKILFNDYETIIEVGDYMVKSSNASIIRVSDIYFRKTVIYKKVDGKQVPEDSRELVIDMEHLHSDGKWSHYGTSSGRDLRKGAVWKRSLEELDIESKKLLDNLGEEKDEEGEPEMGQGLSTLDSSGFISNKKGLIIKAAEIQVKLNYVMMLMESKRWEMRAMVNKMQKEVSRLTTIIWTIELYMGIKEDIVLVQDGEEAPEDEPIHLLQERLYMDEEVGDPTNQGIDFQTIDKFTDWMLSYSDHFGYNNYELLVPYKKCIRIMRVRREGKDYSPNPWENSIMNQPNFETYILIRNGEKLYSISTDMMFGTKLFPGETELMDLYDKLEEQYKNVTYSSTSKEEQLDSEVSRYKRNLVIMQGLVDRTEVFGKVYGKVNFLDGTSVNKGLVNLVYDCDKTNFIGDGKFSFHEWWNETNKDIKTGSRILFSVGGSRYSSGCEYRFFRMFKNAYDREHRAYPPYPDMDELRLLQWDKEEDHFYFTYLPDDDVEKDAYWGTTYGKRTNKVSFAVFSGDDQMNFDAISHREVGWLKLMMHDRRVRRDYMRSMTFLIKVIRIKEAEMELEDPFCQLVIGQTGCSLEEALDLLHWWKTKNKWKRPLKEDDAKALRMIIKEYNRINNNRK